MLFHLRKNMNKPSIKYQSDPKSKKKCNRTTNMHLSEPLLVYQTQLREELTDAGCATSSYSCKNLVSRSLSILFIL